MIYYPSTFYNAGAVIIVVGASLLYSQQARMRPQVAPGSLSVNRISEGAAGLAVAAYLLHSAANDLGGSGALLTFLFQVLPVHYVIMPWLVLLSVAALALLIVISAFRACVGLAGPFPLQKAMKIGGAFLWLAFVVPLWLFGFFVPASWDWGGFGDGINLAMRAFFLFVVVDSVLTIAVLIGAGGGIRRLIDRYQRERNAPLRPVQGGASGRGRWWRVIRRGLRSFEIVMAVFVTIGAIVVAVGGGVMAAAPPPRAVESFVQVNGLTAPAALLAARLIGVAMIVAAAVVVVIVWRGAAKAWRETQGWGDE